jgi:hypothetical protein
MLLGGGLSAVDGAFSALPTLCRARSDLLVTTGDVHRRQRRLMAPAFTPGPMKAWVPMFFELSYSVRRSHSPSPSSSTHSYPPVQLRDLIRERIDTGTVDISAWPSRPAAMAYAETEREGEAVCEMSELIIRLTLDALGKSTSPLSALLLSSSPVAFTGAFGYEFNAMANKRNKLAETLYSLFSPKAFPGKLHPAGFLITNAAVRVIRGFHRTGLLKYIPLAPTKFLHSTLESLEDESRKIIEDKIEKADVEEEEETSVKKKRDLLSIFRSSLLSPSLSFPL